MRAHKSTGTQARNELTTVKVMYSTVCRYIPEKGPGHLQRAEAVSAKGKKVESLSQTPKKRFRNQTYLIIIPKFYTLQQFLRFLFFLFFLRIRKGVIRDTMEDKVRFGRKREKGRNEWMGGEKKNKKPQQQQQQAARWNEIPEEKRQRLRAEQYIKRITT